LEQVLHVVADGSLIVSASWMALAGAEDRDVICVVVEPA
jgi:hypothetical protein